MISWWFDELSDSDAKGGNGGRYREGCNINMCIGEEDDAGEEEVARILKQSKDRKCAQ